MNEQEKEYILEDRELVVTAKVRVFHIRLDELVGKSRSICLTVIMWMVSRNFWLAYHIRSNCNPCVFAAILWLFVKPDTSLLNSIEE